MNSPIAPRFLHWPRLVLADPLALPDEVPLLESDDDARAAEDAAFAAAFVRAEAGGRRGAGDDNAED